MASGKGKKRQLRRDPQRHAKQPLATAPTPTHALVQTPRISIVSATIRPLCIQVPPGVSHRPWEWESWSHSRRYCRSYAAHRFRDTRRRVTPSVVSSATPRARSIACSAASFPSHARTRHDDHSAYDDDSARRTRTLRSVPESFSAAADCSRRDVSHFGPCDPERASCPAQIPLVHLPISVCVATPGSAPAPVAWYVAPPGQGGSAHGARGTAKAFAIYIPPSQGRGASNHPPIELRLNGMFAHQIKSWHLRQCARVCIAHPGQLTR